MDYEPDGTHESLIDSAQAEKTARRTQHLLVAARLAFAFSHGALVVMVSITLGWELGSSWWAVFTPAWLGDAICVVLIVLSWFGSCPYIQLCLQERQARLGDTNPSILTEILPDIVMGILALVFMILALVAEILLCRYLDGLRSAEGPALAPVATFFMVVSVLTCCRGVCISTSGELFNCIGGGALATCVAALTVSGGPLGQSGWVLVLPWVASVAGLQMATAKRIRRCRFVLCREELLLRVSEQAVLLFVLIGLLAIVFVLSPLGQGIPASGRRSRAGAAGIATGAGICVLASLRARMAIAESRHGAISERLMALSLRCGRQRQDSMDPSSIISATGREVPFAASSVSAV
eukprot:gb/GFBE01054052.1/.p1 GENE.gb/GFBE01054052.1/~~gb/GFBE01054052.1/.p1  ORF type:complete len:351 (+),score=43.87 gb/GFBE01054052.1/:1-1053(+)